ncbi:MAG: hypothetical protein IPN20_01505 [Haliscomenobacter sp.]|nr:hypothetical protein [Haliscomenobacter sp.]
MDIKFQIQFFISFLAFSKFSYVTLKAKWSIFTFFEEGSSLVSAELAGNNAIPVFPESKKIGKKNN